MLKEMTRSTAVIPVDKIPVDKALLDVALIIMLFGYHSGMDQNGLSEACI